jgi:glycosyltransferase involved in cell wall biosynthesis
MHKVSVIVPNFNHDRFLNNRINSILSQTYQDFEVLIFDDCSIDRSFEILKQYEHHPKVSKFIRNKTNSGSPFKQWIKGISLSKGEYIWIAESDDFADPRFLEKLVPVLEQNPDVGLVYCQSHKIDEAGNIIGNMKEWTDDLDENRWQNDFINNGKAELQNYFYQKNTIPNASAVLFRKDSFQRNIGKIRQFSLCGDMMLYTIILEKSNLAFKAESLNYYRFHTQSVRNQTSYLKVQNELIIWAGYLLKHIKLSKTAKNFLLQERLGKQLQNILHSSEFRTIQKFEIYGLTLRYNLPLLIYLLKINQGTWLKNELLKWRN